MMVVLGWRWWLEVEVVAMMVAPPHLAHPLSPPPHMQTDRQTVRPTDRPTDLDVAEQQQCPVQHRVQVLLAPRRPFVAARAQL